jgi:hypothetical protein
MNKDGHFLKKHGYHHIKKINLNSDKERFGRVRKSMMTYLREKYGSQVADRALWRVIILRTEGYFKT